MAKLQKNKKPDYEIQIGHEDSKPWSSERLSGVKAFIKAASDKRTAAQKRRTEMLSIRYQMEEYLDDHDAAGKKGLSVETFLHDYLRLLNLSFKRFALSIDSTDGNLKKYLSGDRKFNIDLAMRFASFFHTSPDIWLRIDMKNQLTALSQQKAKMKHYKKYDYTRLPENSEE